MPVSSFKQLRLTILLTLLFSLFACAQPAHKNTLPWNLNAAYTQIKLVAPDQYLVDGMYFEQQSLQQWLTSRQHAGLLLPLLLETPDELNFLTRRNYFELASIAHHAEQLGFEVFYSSAGFIHSKTSSAELLAMADNQNTPIDDESEDFD